MLGIFGPVESSTSFAFLRFVDGGLSDPRFRFREGFVGAFASEDIAPTLPYAGNGNGGTSVREDPMVRNNQET